MAGRPGAADVALPDRQALRRRQGSGGAAMTPLRSVALLLAIGIGAAGCRRPPEPPRSPAATSGSTVTLTPRALALTGVQTERAQVTTVPESFTTTGEIEFDPSR